MNEAEQTVESPRKGMRAHKPSVGEADQSSSNHESSVTLQQSAPISNPVPLTSSRCPLLEKALGPILICGGAVLTTITNYLFKVIAGAYSVSAFELTMTRGLYSILVGVGGMCYYRLSPLSLATEDAFLVSAYATIYTLGITLYALGLISVQVSLAAVVFCTLPIIVAILGRLILKETVTVLTMVCTLISVCGLAMVMKQPAALFGKGSNTNNMILLYVALVLLSAVCVAFSGLASRKMAGRISFFVTAFYAGILMVIIHAFVLYFANTHPNVSVARFFIIMAYHTLPYISQLVLYFAHKYALAVTCSYYVFGQALLAFFGDILILGVNMDYIQIIGAVTIILCCGAITTQKVLTASAATP